MVCSCSPTSSSVEETLPASEAEEAALLEEEASDTAITLPGLDNGVTVVLGLVLSRLAMLELETTLAMALDMTVTGEAVTGECLRGGKGGRSFALVCS